MRTAPKERDDKGYSGETTVFDRGRDKALRDIEVDMEALRLRHDRFMAEEPAGEVSEDVRDALRGDA